MGGKSTTATQSVQIPAEVLARYNAVNARAEDVASRPFIPYSEDPNAFVAALTPSQRAGIENINAVAGMSQPSFMAGQGMIQGGIGQAVPMTYGALGTGAQYAGEAGQAISAGRQAISPEQFSQQALQPYMSPYMANVVAAQQALQQQEAAQQRSALTGEAIRAGAFGGDRAGIAQANLARQQSLANQATLANLLQSGYTQGLGAFQQQQGVNLAAAQANRAAQQNAAQQLAALGQQQYGQQLGAGQNLYQMGLGGGQAYAGLGSQAEQAALNAAQAQMAAGQIQQQTDQAAKTAMYNQFLQQQGYPYQQAQFLGNLAMGTGALSGSTTTTTQPSGWSDRRLKENVKKIGETFDGQAIYRYNLKGEPRTQIGLMAQEVEKDNPRAVGESQGYKTLDYKKATDEAAKRGHFASGGLVPSSMGGAVLEPGAFARGGYANGGTIEEIYQNSLGRYGSPDEYNYWLGTGLSMDEIANAIANSPEGQQYASTTKTAQPSGSTYSGLAGGFEQRFDEDGNLYYYNPDNDRRVSQYDYYNMFGDPSEEGTIPNYDKIVESMYKGELGRTGTPEEYAYWVGQLNSGKSFAEIQNAISASPEGAAYDQKTGPVSGLNPTDLTGGVKMGTGALSSTGTTSGAAGGTSASTTTGGTTAGGTTSGTGGWYGSAAGLGGNAPLMPTGIKAYPYQPAMVYNPNAFVQSPYLARNAYGFYAAPQGSSYSSFANPMGSQQQATGKGPSSMGGGYGYQPQAFAQPSYNYTPQVTGKGPQSYGGYSSAPSYGNTSGGSMPQATGKGSSSGGGGWASGGRVSKSAGGLLELARSQAGMYGQMPGSAGTEPFSRIKHTLVKAEVPRHLIPGSLPARPQSGAKSAMETGKMLADLYKSGKEIKRDVFDRPPAQQPETKGGETTTRSTPGSSAPAGAKTSGLVPDDDRSMTASVGRGASDTFDPFQRAEGPRDVYDLASFRAPDVDVSDFGDSFFLNTGGRVGYAAGGGRLPAGLDPEGIDIPDELPGYKLNEQVPKGPGGGGGGGSGLGTALTVASTAAKIIPFLASLSDRRVKENSEVIGKLYDGQKVYRYDFGDGRTELGLMAQEVEKHNPDAVRSLGGLKMVDYDKATSRAHKQGGGGLGDIIDDVPYSEVLDQERRGLAPDRIRLAALSPTGTMSDAEPIGPGGGARIAQAAAPAAAVAPAVEAPAAAAAPATAETPPPEQKRPAPSPVDRAGEIASRYTKGPWERIGEELKAPSLLRDERVIVPLIAGFGAMLASDKPRFSQALGEGLAGAAGAYGAVRGQTQEISESEARQRLMGVQTAGARFKEFRDGRIMYLHDGNWIDMGTAYDLLEKGELKDIDFPTAERIRAEYRSSQGLPTKPAAPAGEPAPAGGAAEKTTTSREPAGAPSGAGAVSAEGLSPEDAAIANRWKKESRIATEKWLADNPDIYTPQQQVAAAAREMQSQFNPMASALISAPPKGILATGALQPVLRPMLGYLNSMASTFGVEPISEKDFAKREEALKYIERIKAAASKDKAAFAALEAMGKGFPSDVNSKEGIARMLAGMQIENTREIDKNDYFQAFKSVAEQGQSAVSPRSNRSGSYANLQERFNKNRAAVDSKEKEGLVRMYLSPVEITRQGQQMYLGQNGKWITKDDIARGVDRPMSWAEHVIKNGADMTDKQKQFIQNSFGYNPKGKSAPNILRHFGM